MKRLLLVALALLAALSAQGQSALKGTRLTDAEILRGIPEGIVKPTPMPMGFPSEGVLRYRAGSEIYDYSLKDGSRTLVAPEPRIRTHANEQMVTGWVNPTWSPDSTKIAFTLENDLYSTKLSKQKTLI